MWEGTVDGIFRQSLQRYPERRFMHYLVGSSEHVLTYREASSIIAQTVEALDQAGVKAGDRVVCYLEAVTPSTWFMLACAHAAIIPVPLPPVFSVEAAKDLVDQVQAKAVFTTAELAPKLIEAGIRPMAYGSGSDSVHWLDPVPKMPADRAWEVLSRFGAQHDGDAPYMIQPTSGSTGRPKLVLRNHRTFVRIGKYKMLDYTPEQQPQQRVLLLCPLTHGMGHNILGAALWMAAQLSIPNEVDTRASLDELRKLDPTYLQMAPRVLRELYQRHLERTGGDPSPPLFGPSAQALTVGGAPPDPKLLHYVKGQGVDIIEGYSASEMSIVSLTRRGHWREGVVGEILPDVEARIAEDGELLAKTPVLMLGYYGEPEQTKNAFTPDGFYKTGDYAEITPDRCLRLLGRKKDVFNTYDGSNIHPARIEEQLERISWVRQGALVGDQRPYVVALVVVDGNGASSDTEGYLPPDKAPELYARAGEDLAKLNSELESNERIRRFALFERPMSDKLYSPAGQGKVRRNRSEIVKTYTARIEALYKSSVGATVPGAEV